MILSIDVGNSTIVFGSIDKDNIRILNRVQTDPQKSVEEYVTIITEMLKINNISQELLEDAVISSVVPAVNMALKAAMCALCGKEPLFVTADTKTGLQIEGNNPQQLGSDVVAGCVAAMELYPLPMVVIDIGTATTLSVVNKSRCYVGGMILPGPRLLAQALSSSTALLPEVRIEAPDNFLGQSTEERIKSGIVYGCAALLEGTLQRIETVIGEKPTVVATGGFASLVFRYCNLNAIYDELLITEGLALIYSMNRA